MKIKIILIVALSFLFAKHFYGQNSTTPNGWEKIYIKNLGSFDLPPTMEVQKGKYNEFLEEVKKIKGYDASQLTAQQKGLNEFGKESFEKYARVIVETTLGFNGDFEKYNFNIIEVTQSDITILNSIYKQQIQQSFLVVG